MPKLFRFLCVMVVLFGLALSGAQANRYKNPEKSSEHGKQKSSSKSRNNAKNERGKKALSEDKSKAGKGKKKGEKEIADTKGKHGKKDASERHKKELTARDKKNLSRKEQQELARKEKSSRETKSKKSRREEIAVNKKPAKESPSREVEQTRPRYAKSAAVRTPITPSKPETAKSQPLSSNLPPNTDKMDDRSSSSKLSPEPLPAGSGSPKEAPLPAAQNNGIEVIEEKAKVPEAKLLPPPAKPETNSSPAISAKNTAAGASANALRTTNETTKPFTPQPQGVEVKSIPLVSASKPGDVKLNPSQQKNDEAKLTPNQLPSGLPQQPRNESGSDDTQQNPNNSRSGIPGDRIIEIQKALIKHGYLDGEPTGVYDDNTKQAMKRFQTANNLSATGLPSAHALKKLGVAKRREDGYAVPVKNSAQSDKRTP